MNEWVLIGLFVANALISVGLCLLAFRRDDRVRSEIMDHVESRFERLMRRIDSTESCFIGKTERVEARYERLLGHLGLVEVHRGAELMKSSDALAAGLAVRGAQEVAQERRHPAQNAASSTDGSHPRFT